MNVLHGAGGKARPTKTTLAFKKGLFLKASVVLVEADFREKKEIAGNWFQPKRR